MRSMGTLLAIMLLTLAPAAAEDEHHGTDTEAGHEASDHHDFRHELSLFVGGTDFHEEVSPTLLRGHVQLE